MTRRWLVALSVLAAVNLSAGLWMSVHPAAYPTEAQRVGEWAHMWVQHINPYAQPASGVDYPPWALVSLWPLSLVSASVLPFLWPGVNLVLAVVLAWLLARQSGENQSHRTMLILLFCAMACLRTLGQFSLLSFTLALAGAFAPSSVIGGLLLGLSLMKPQIGGVALLWTIFVGRWRRAALAAAVPIALTILFMTMVSIGPTALARQYASVIAFLYGSPASLPGNTEIRGWLWPLFPSPEGNLWLMLAVFVGLLLPAIVARARRRIADRDTRLELLALCGAASLLVMRHLSYDFILLLPAIIAWRSPPFATLRHEPRWMFYGLATLLIAAVPSWIRLGIRWGAPSALSIVTQLDRAMCLGVWVLLAWRLNSSGGIQSSDSAKLTGT